MLYTHLAITRFLYRTAGLNKRPKSECCSTLVASCSSEMGVANSVVNDMPRNVDTSVMFLVKCLQSKSDDSNFNIFDYIKFCSSSVTRSSGVKLTINYARTSTYRHFYFNRIVHIYNAICSVITLSDSYYTIQCKVTDYLWSYFNSHFNPHNTCTFHLICPCNSCHASGLYI